MFESGNYVMYGNAGVCLIQDITNKINGEKRDRTYYVLKPVYEIGTIYTPIDNQKMRIRDLLSKREINKLLKVLSDTKIDKLNGFNSQQITEYYKGIIESQDCFSLLKLIKAIYSKKIKAEKEKKKFGEIDRRYMEKAENLVFGEFAISLDIPKEEVPTYIKQHVD